MRSNANWHRRESFDCYQREKPERLTILHVAADGDVGGGTTHVLDLIAGADNGARHVVATSAGSALESAARARGCETVAIVGFGWRSLFGGFTLRKAASRSAVDLVHAHGARSTALAGIARLSQPIVRTVHGLHIEHHRGARRRIAKTLERFADRVAVATVFVSDSDRRAAERLRLHKADRQTFVIPNGISVEAFESVRRTWDLAWVGRLEDVKQPLRFVDIVERMPGCRAVLVGDGSLRDDVATRVKGSTARARIDVLGSRERSEVHRLLTQAKVLLMTSRNEGVPYVVLEAMAAGAVVVAPRIGGIAEVLGDAGIVVANTADELVRAASAVLAAPNERDAIAGIARARFEDRYDLGRMIAATSDVYRWALESRVLGGVMVGGDLVSVAAQAASA